MDEMEKIYKDSMETTIKQQAEDLKMRKQMHEQSMKTLKHYEETAKHMKRQTEALESIAKSLAKIC
jgi:hypothetical protein